MTERDDGQTGAASTDRQTDDHASLLQIRDLDVTFETRRGDVHAVNGVDLTVGEGEILCLVGESGSGKSVATQSIVDLVPTPPGGIEGEIYYKDRDLREAPAEEIRALRGEEIGVIFQDPMSSLNPVHTVGHQIREAIEAHRDWDGDRVRERAIELMEEVGIPDASARFSDYPSEFSGGMRQRVMIAIALANEPDLLIADEPTTALDVTIEAQIFDLIRDLNDEFDTSVIWITHDLGVVAEMADRVAVMYGGEVVERGTVFDIFDDPKHPYTTGLLRSIPGAGGADDGRLEPVEGEPPDMMNPPSGCTFHPRCPEAMPHCEQREPPVYDVDDGSDRNAEDDGDPTHTTKCFLYEDRPTVEEVAEPTGGTAQPGREGDK